MISDAWKYACRRPAVFEPARARGRARHPRARLPVALAPVAAGAPSVDVRAKLSAGSPSVDQLERLREERGGGRDRVELVAAAGEVVEHVCAVDVREGRRLGEPAGAVQLVDRPGGLRPGTCAPRRRRARPEARARARPTRRGRARARRARRRRPRSPPPRGRPPRVRSRFRRAGACSTTPISRKVASTPSRVASHSTVSPVGRVFPRSIWLTYPSKNARRRACLRQPS